MYERSSYDIRNSKNAKNINDDFSYFPEPNPFVQSNSNAGNAFNNYNVSSSNNGNPFSSYNNDYNLSQNNLYQYTSKKDSPSFSFNNFGKINFKDLPIITETEDNYINTSDSNAMNLDDKQIDFIKIPTNQKSFISINNFKFNSDIKTSIQVFVSELTSLILHNNLYEALNLMNSNTPINFSNQTIATSLLKLYLFKLIANEEHFNLQTVLNFTYNSIIAQDDGAMKYEAILKLINFPGVFKSRYYRLTKQEEYINAIVKLITVEADFQQNLLLNSSNYENVENHLHQLNLFDENLILQNMEYEIAYVITSFFESLEICSDFDEFAYNSEIKFDLTKISDFSKLKNGIFKFFAFDIAAGNLALEKIINQNQAQPDSSLIHQKLDSINKFQKEKISITSQEIIDEIYKEHEKDDFFDIYLKNQKSNFENDIRDSNNSKTQLSSFNKPSLKSTSDTGYSFNGKSSFPKTSTIKEENLKKNPFSGPVKKEEKELIINLHDEQFDKELPVINNNKLTKVKNTKLSVLKKFNFKFVKRENIDKKIIRKFRKYLEEKPRNNYEIPINNYSFIDSFQQNKLFPPMTTEDGIVFKSFNTSYMIWLFTQNNTLYYYNEFIQNNLLDSVKLIVNTFKVTDKTEIGLIRNYLLLMGKVYSNFEFNEGDETSHFTSQVNTESMISKKLDGIYSDDEESVQNTKTYVKEEIVSSNTFKINNSNPKVFDYIKPNSINPYNDYELSNEEYIELTTKPKSNPFKSAENQNIFSISSLSTQNSKLNSLNKNTQNQNPFTLNQYNIQNKEAKIQKEIKFNEITEAFDDYKADLDDLDY